MDTGGSASAGTDRDAARRLLGVGPEADHPTIRTAYRRLIRRSHPDVNTGADAGDRTRRLTEAYRLLVSAPLAQRDLPGRTRGERPESGADSSGAAARRATTVAVALVDPETIGVAAPPDETLLLLLEAAHRLGEVSYLDRSVGLVEIVVEFIAAPTSSVVLSLQGRATGVTEVFCTVEPLSGGTAPSAAAVTRLLLDTLVGADPGA
jgi:hypothetical protein